MTRLSLPLSEQFFLRKRERPGKAETAARVTLDGEREMKKLCFDLYELSSAGSFRLFRRIWGARDRVILKMVETSGENARKSGKWETACVYDVDDKFARLRPVEIQQFVAFFTWAWGNIFDVEKICLQAIHSLIFLKFCNFKRNMIYN